jgi:Lysine methyltransferase
MNQGSPTSEEDAFWKIALDEEVGSQTEEKNRDPSSEPTCVYVLDLREPYATLQCQLTALPLPSWTEQSTGAQAWYGSALLSALLLQSPHDDDRSRIHQYICAHARRRHSSISILELGSGAVGLAGVVAGFSILTHLRTISLPREGAKTCRVFLTDHDPHVLHQLELNVRSNEMQWLQRFAKSEIPEFVVKSLDWKDGWRRDASIHLVIGSELVYNTNTACDCAQLVLQLLQDFPGLLVVLVQVTHRDGWIEVFLPTVRQTAGVVIQEEVPSHELHTAASKLVAPGGTLHPRADFTVCYIYHQNEEKYYSSMENLS